MSEAEETFAAQLKADGFPPFEREYRFHPTRRWRFDFAWPYGSTPAIWVVDRSADIDIERLVNARPGSIIMTNDVDGIKQLGSHIAVEIEGGIWVKGAHTRGKHFESDCEKYNEAQKLGWQVYRFTPDMVNDGRAVAFMKEVLKP